MSAIPAAAVPDPGRPARYWPLGAGRIVTSPWGPRPGGFHFGTDFGRVGGSANMPVYACQAGTVIFAGAASGYGGPDPAGWLVIDSSTSQGSGCVEYGHIVREVARGDVVRAGQRIAHINPDPRTNGGVAPHLHVSVMPAGYDPAAKMDPMPWLQGAREPQPQPRDERPVLRRGSRGEAVGDLQRALRRLGFALAIDDDFGPRTERAVIRFQRDRDLEPDGIVGPLTWRALDRALAGDR